MKGKITPAMRKQLRLERAKERQEKAALRAANGQKPADLLAVFVSAMLILFVVIILASAVVWAAKIFIGLLV